MEADSEKSELKIIHTVLQIAGFAPFQLGKSGLSLPLACYNVILSLLILSNIWSSKSDKSNGNVKNSSYVNKTNTTVVDHVFSAIDIFGNTYIALFIILAIFRSSKLRAITDGMNRVSTKLNDLGVIVDHKTAKVYFCVKLAVILTLSLIIILVTLYLEFAAGNYFTITYWIGSMYPNVVMWILVLVYGSYVTRLFTQVWVINEYLRVLCKEYEDREQTAKSVRWNLSTHTSLTSVTNVLTRNSAISSMLKLVNTQSESQNKRNTERPTLAFICNYPKCFERADRNIFQDLRAVRSSHFAMLELAESIQEYFGDHFVCIIVIHFFGVIINFYAAVTFHVVKSFAEDYYSSILWSFFYLILVIIIVAYNNRAVGEAIQSIKLVNQFLVMVKTEDSDIEKELKNFAMQIVNNPVAFTASGYFSINSALLLSFLIGVISNVIFIVQFDMINLQAGQNKQ